MIKLNPYLNFAGNTEEAFNFYKSVFGGEFATVMRFGDVESLEGTERGTTEANRIMHIALPIGEEMLMGTDTSDAEDENLEPGNNFTLSISPDTEKEADELFSKLSAGGSTEVEMRKEFWGDYFGMCTDKFGIRWMINVRAEEK